MMNILLLKRITAIITWIKINKLQWEYKDMYHLGFNLIF